MTVKCRSLDEWIKKVPKSKNYNENSKENYPIPYEGSEDFVFISYVHLDNQKMEIYNLIDILQSNGINIWYDKGIHLSHDYRNIIFKKINECKVFLPLISPNLFSSTMSKQEIYYAKYNNKPLATVFLKETNFSEFPRYGFGIEGTIMSDQVIFKYQLNDDAFYKKLINEVQGLLRTD